jgi:hypothetical protein
MKEIREAFEELAEEVTSDTVDGVEFWFVMNQRRSSGRKDMVHLLQTYDETVVAYTESRYFGDPHAQRARAAWRDRNLPTGVVLLNDRVAGVWRRSTTPRSIGIEVYSFDRPSARLKDALGEAAARLGAFTGLEPSVQVSVG